MSDGGVNISGIDHSSIHANIIAGRDVIQYLIQGPQQLPTDYGFRISNFLYEYLGDLDNKVPFGGRDNELSDLTQWLDTPTAPSCLLLTAEAGRGKSALLVRWCAQLRQREDVAVIFVPVSIRFETAAAEVFYTSLAASLAKAYGEEVNYQSLSFEQYKEICRVYLNSKHPRPDGKQILVIIDGIDEAGGWKIGEHFLSSTTVRVIVSARIEAWRDKEEWLRQLGWQGTGTAKLTSLLPLTREGVKAVLKDMGNPLDAFTTNVNLIGELFRLTGGDPLLVRLYVGALIGNGTNSAYLIPEQLEGIEEGLKGYFDKWWEDQFTQWEAKGRNPIEQQKNIEEFLFAIATAFGPLSNRDILALTEGRISSTLSKRIAQEVGRFIIGDGKTTGYVFSHPRLSYYFFDPLEPEEKELWNNRFVNYGKLLLDDLQKAKRKPTEAQGFAYALQHHTAHLERANAPATDFYDLICQVWAQAWESLRGTYDGFLTDVERVWSRAATDPDKMSGIKMQIWCALCKSSVISLTSNISAELLVGATKADVLSITQAIVLWRQSQEGENKEKTLHLLAETFTSEKAILEQLLQNCHKIEYLVILAPYLPDAVLEASRTIADEQDRTRVLRVLALHLPDAVLEATRTLKYKRSRINVLTALAPKLPPHTQKKVWQGILNTIQSTKDEAYRTRLLVALAPHMPNVVLEIAYAIKNDLLRADALEALAPYLPSDVLKAMRTFKDIRSGESILTALAPHLPLAILEATRAIIHEGSRSVVLASLAPHLSNVVLQATLAIKDEWYRANVLTALAPHLPDAVLRAALVIKDEWSRSNVLTSLAPQLPAIVLEAAFAIKDERHLSNVLTALAPQLPDAVLQAALTIKDEGHRANVLIALTPHLPHNVLQASRIFTHERYRSEVLTALSPYLPVTQQPNIWQEALQATYSIKEDELYRATVFTAIAAYLPTQQQTQVRQEILHVARIIEHEESRATILIGIAPHLPSAVMEVALTIKDERQRAEVIIALAPHLPSAVMEAALVLTDEGQRANVLIALIPHLPTAVLKALPTIKKEERRADVLIAFAPYVSESPHPQFLQGLLQVAYSIRDQQPRAEVLTAFASQIPPNLQESMWQAALRATRSIEFESSRYEVLAHLAPYLPDSVLRDVHAIKDEENRAVVLTALAPHRPHMVRSVANSFKDTRYRAEVLTCLAPHLPVEQQPHAWQEALQAAQSIREDETWRDSYRAAILTSLAPHLPIEQQPHVWQEALQATYVISSEGHRTNMLISLIPYLPESQQSKVREEALQTARSILSESSRSALLIALVPYLPENQQPQVWNEVIQALYSMGGLRARHLPALVPYLIARLRRYPLHTSFQWHQILHQSANRPRLQILKDLGILIPFILALIEAESSTNQTVTSPSLTEPQKKMLLHLISLSGIRLDTVIRRIDFVVSAGLSALSSDLHLELSQNVFVQRLLNTVLEKGIAPDGESYSLKLLRYLRDDLWYAKETPRAFIDSLLSAPPTSTAQQQLAQEVFNTVQEVCHWWP